MWQAVTFDFWNTLCISDPTATAARRRAAWRQVAQDRDIQVESEVLDEVLGEVSTRHHEGWMRNEQFTTDHALAHAVGLLESVLGPGDAEALTAAFYEASARADIALTPHCAEVLAELDRRGTRIGIICDVGLTPSPMLRRVLERNEILQHFDHWSFSDEVGVYKPSSAIFAHALGGLRSLAEDAAHIGDIRRTDVAGARGVGMTSIRYCAVADDADDDYPEADHVTDDLRFLL